MNNISTLSTGIDVKAIVSSLMDVEKLQLGRLSKNKTLFDNQLSGYDQLSFLLSKFSQSSSDLHQILGKNSYKIAPSDASTLNAVLTGSTTSIGVHNIDITQLAQAHQISSSAFTSKDSALNLSGTFSVQTGTHSLSLDIEPDNSLETIRDRINNSINNNGITAAIITTTSAQGAPEFRLLLSSKETGIANQMNISNDSKSLLSLTNDLKPAQDALFTFDGLNVVRSSNTISDVMDNVTFTLNVANKSANINISVDNTNKVDAVKASLKSFVDNFNTLVDTIDKNQANKSLRDNTYSFIKTRLQQALSSNISNNGINNLFDLGIKTAEASKLFNADGVEYVSTGKLIINNDQLDKVLNNNFDALNTFFSNSSQGMTKVIQNTLTNISETGGLVYNRESIIKKQESILQDQIDREDQRLDAVQENLIKRYSELNTFVQRQQQMSNFIEQQLASMNFNKK